MFLFSLFNFFSSPQHTVGTDRRNYTATYRLISVLHHKAMAFSPKSTKTCPIFIDIFKI